MGVLSSLYTGVSGLKSQGEALSVISDNIANANTTGFKSSRAEFADMMSRNLKGIDGGNQIGRGTFVSAVNPILTQGNIDHTDKVTDLALNGDGYFQVKGSEGVAYTRDGSFHFDKEGNLVNTTNQKVQGYLADEKGVLQNKIGDIKFPRALVQAKQTKEVKLDLNLDSRVDPTKKFNIEDPYNSSHFSTGVEVFDSQGNKHVMTLFFNKVADRKWEYTGLVDGKEVTGAEDDKLASVLKGQLNFTQDGKLDSNEILDSNLNFRGGALQNQQIVMNFGDEISKGGKGVEGTKQYGRDSDAISWQQDGYAAGTITNLSFNEEGILTASYSNGQVADLARIGIAKFSNPEALFKIGNNMMKESRDSGVAVMGAPRESGRASIFSKSLERSTVDLASEFVGMIQNQRSFQANAKTITTTDELLNEIINLKR